jgi:hypothetical protein
METNLENTLISALKTGFVVFFYRKINGEKRAAVGTSNIALVKQISCWRPKGDCDCNRGSAYAYFDLIDGAWRSFRRDNLIDIAINDFGCPVNSKYRYVTDTQTAIRMAIKYAALKSDTTRMEDLVDLLLYGQTVVTCDKIIADIKVDEDTKAAYSRSRSTSDIIDDINESSEELVSLVHELTRRLIL